MVPSSTPPAAQPSQPIARLRGVTCFDEDGSIVQDVDWTILPGEHWALIGANGSGKTTLARMLSAYLWPSLRTIEVPGERCGATDIPTLRRAVAFVSPALAPRIPVEHAALDVVLSGLDAHLGLHRASVEDERRWALRCLVAVGLVELSWTGEVLWRAYGRPCRVSGGRGRFQLEVLPRSPWSSVSTGAGPVFQRP